MKCPYCGSENIEEGVAWGKTAEVGNIGPRYKLGLFVGVTQAYSDFCLDCGTITRLFIKDLQKRPWVKTPGSLGSI